VDVLVETKFITSDNGALTLATQDIEAILDPVFKAKRDTADRQQRKRDREKAGLPPPAPPDPPAAPSKPKPKTNPDIKKFIDSFYSRFLVKTGKKYHVTGGKDATIIKRLLGTHSLADLNAYMETFFCVDDSFTKDAGYTIPVFASQINKITGGQYGKHQKSSRQFDAAKDSADKFGGR
jgi:hypothetical protein